MMNPNFDPYDLLMSLTDRLNRLEQAHNHMAHAYSRSEQDLIQAKKRIKQLEASHKHLNDLVFEGLYRNNITIGK